MAALLPPRPRTLFPDEVWGPLVARSSWRGLAMVAHCWAVIAGASALCILWPNPLTWLLAVMITGGRQLGLAILMHEAAHGTLHPDQRINDAVGEYLCAAPVGADLKRYRPYHFTHHVYTQQDEDPDLVLSRPFPTTRASLRRKFIRDLTGQTFFKQRIAPLLAARRTAERVFGDADRAARRRFALANAGIFLIYALCGQAVWFFLIWGVAFATWFPLVTRIRNIAEHACTSRAPDPFTVARTTRAGWLARAFIAPYYVNYHAEHHLFVAVPCYRLPRLFAALRAAGAADRMQVAPGYAAVLREVAQAG